MDEFKIRMEFTKSIPDGTISIPDIMIHTITEEQSIKQGYIHSDFVVKHLLAVAKIKYGDQVELIRSGYEKLPFIDLGRAYGWTNKATRIKASAT